MNIVASLSKMLHHAHKICTGFQRASVGKTLHVDYCCQALIWCPFHADQSKWTIIVSELTIKQWYTEATAQHIHAGTSTVVAMLVEYLNKTLN